MLAPVRVGAGPTCHPLSLGSPSTSRERARESRLRAWHFGCSAQHRKIKLPLGPDRTKLDLSQLLPPQQLVRGGTCPGAGCHSVKTKCLYANSKSEGLWDEMLPSTPAQVRRAVIPHRLAGTYRQFPAPFWQLWKMSERAERQATQTQKQSKDDDSTKIHGNQRSSANHNVQLRTCLRITSEGKRS